MVGSIVTDRGMKSMTLDRSFSKERTMYERWDETGDGRAVIINNAYKAAHDSLKDDCPDMVFPGDDRAENLISAITRFYNEGKPRPLSRVEKIRQKLAASDDPLFVRMGDVGGLSDEQLKRLSDIVTDSAS
jgi:hypothetical protein